jgi:hypothetical protein
MHTSNFENGEQSRQFLLPTGDDMGARSFDCGRSARKAMFTCILAALCIGNVFAQNRFIGFTIANPGKGNVTVTVTAGECYEGAAPSGQRYNIGPSQNTQFVLARVQGHGCNGKNGLFSLTMNPGADGNDVQWLAFDNAGVLWRHNIANPYPGTLTMTSANNFTYALVSAKQLKLGQPTGNWALICSPQCTNVVFKKEVTNSIANSSSMSEEIKTAISVSLTEKIGNDASPVSAELNITASMEATHNKTLSNEVLNGKLDGSEVTQTWTNEQLAEHKIGAIWQWQTSMTAPGGGVVVIKEPIITCTQGPGRRPTWGPMVPMQVDACRGALASASVAPVAVAQQQAAPAAKQASPQVTTTPALTCQQMSDRYNISANVSWGTADAQVQAAWVALRCTTKPASSSPAAVLTYQQMSDQYAVVANRGFGFAPEDARRQWVSMACNTAPSAARVPALCQQMSNQYKIYANQTWGNADTNVQGSWVGMSCTTKPI